MKIKLVNFIYIYMLLNSVGFKSNFTLFEKQTITEENKFQKTWKDDRVMWIDNIFFYGLNNYLFFSKQIESLE